MLAGVALEPLPACVVAAARGRRHVRGERARQGARRRGGARPGRDRRRLGHRGRGARRRARDLLGALRRPGRDGRGEPRPAPRARRRRARRCATSASWPTPSPDGDERVFEGACDGTLAADARGSGGFGYDPAFLPDDVADGRTMAELSDAEKDAISHRGRAARALLAWLARSGGDAPLGADGEPARAAAPAAVARPSERADALRAAPLGAVQRRRGGLPRRAQARAPGSRPARSRSSPRPPTPRPTSSPRC